MIIIFSKEMKWRRWATGKFPERILKGKTATDEKTSSRGIKVIDSQGKTWEICINQIRLKNE